MPRRDDGQQSREAVLEPAVRVDDFGFLAGMRGGGGDDGTGAEHVLKRGELVLVGRGRRNVELEIAGGGDARRAEPGVARAVVGRLREAEIEPAQQRADGAWHHPPAVERALRQPPIDQDQRHVALRRRHDHRRPQIGFDEQCEIRLPMIEKARRELRQIDGRKLMDDVRRQSLLGDAGRRDRAGGDQHVEILRAHALDQREDGDHLADAGAMKPDQPACGTRNVRLAAPLRQANRVLLALPEPVGQHHRRHRRGRGHQQPVRTQRQWQSFSHPFRPRLCRRRSHRRAPWPHSAKLRPHGVPLRASHRRRWAARGSASRRRERRGRTENERRCDPSCRAHAAGWSRSQADRSGGRTCWPA